MGLTLACLHEGVSFRFGSVKRVWLLSCRWQAIVLVLGLVEIIGIPYVALIIAHRQVSTQIPNSYHAGIMMCDRVTSQCIYLQDGFALYLE